MDLEVSGLGASGLAWVALGGALGGMARLAVTRLFTRWFGVRALGHLPWDTLTVNLSGALLAGWLAARLGMPVALDATTAWLALVVGGLGGYTTVSTFSLQALSLWQDSRRRAIGYTLATVLAGLALAGLGWWLAGGGR